MNDINFQLRTSYFSLLSGNVLVNGLAIPIYYGQTPLSATPPNPDNYVLIETVYSNNFNDDRFNYTNTTVQLTIVTKKLQNNSGAIADDIANQIYQIIYPYPAAQIVQITNGYVIDTKMFLDRVLSGLNDGEKKVINRIISFIHPIQHSFRGIPTSGNIYYGVQDTNDDPIDFSQSINQNGNLPISVDYGVQPDPKFYWLAVPDVFTDKENWEDLNDTGNAGDIGEETDLFVIRTLIIGSTGYRLYMTQYLTGFNEPTAQVRYY